MPSSTLFLATEADAGMGHIAPWYRLCELALQQGHSLHMAAPQVGQLNAIIGQKLDVSLWQSPRLSHPQAYNPAMAAAAPKSWPELLVSLGYADATQLQGMVKAWCNILRHVRPDVVVADYAPALLLAAHRLGIPSIEAGGGFWVPPLAPRPSLAPSSPSWPGFPGTKHADASLIAQADRALTQAFNQALAQGNKRPALQTFGDTATWPAHRVVLSPAELDPYVPYAPHPHHPHHAPRTDVTYAGLLQPSAASMPNTAWLPSPCPRVVGYLQANTPGLASLVDQLAAAQIPACLYVAGSTFSAPQQHGSVTLTRQPLDLVQALSQAEVYLCNGGLSGVGLALHKGCWPVLVPLHAEQVATARILVRRQWGGLWLPDTAMAPDALTRTVFAPRARCIRLQPAAVSAEQYLLQLVGEMR